MTVTTYNIPRYISLQGKGISKTEDKKNLLLGKPIIHMQDGFMSEFNMSSKSKQAEQVFEHDPDFCIMG